MGQKGAERDGERKEKEGKRPAGNTWREETRERERSQREAREAKQSLYSKPGVYLAIAR